MQPYLIAHACGQIDKLVYSNSKEALNNSYKHGFRFIEFDISQTKDGKFILLHDFEETRYKLFGKKGKCNFSEFMSDKMIGGYQQLSLDDIIAWFEDHNDCYIVTDSKDADIIELCQYILKKSPKLKDNLIIQIYSFAEYQHIKSLGISKIIFATYKTEATNNEIIDFLKNNACYAVSMSLEKAKNGFANAIKENMDLWVLAFTLNQENLISDYKKIGVDGFFTDKIIPS